MGHADHTLTPQDIAIGYQRAYEAIHGHTPRIQHMSGYWYQVNDEIVHRSTLTTEIIRLKQLERSQQQQQRAAPRKAPEARVERSVITRLISRLRAI